jgi:hypothetical protein
VPGGRLRDRQAVGHADGRERSAGSDEVLPQHVDLPADKPPMLTCPADRTTSSSTSPASTSRCTSGRTTSRSGPWAGAGSASCRWGGASAVGSTRERVDHRASNRGRGSARARRPRLRARLRPRPQARARRAHAEEDRRPRGTRRPRRRSSARRRTMARPSPHGPSGDDLTAEVNPQAGRLCQAE